MPKNRPDLAHEVNDEVNILSFIVRVWKEEPTSEKQLESWRGHITLVPNGNRHYFSNIKDITAFIADQLSAQR